MKPPRERLVLRARPHSALAFDFTREETEKKERCDGGSRQQPTHQPIDHSEGVAPLVPWPPFILRSSQSRSR
eukprot:2204388-Prymnesium_polylepis.1